MSRQIAIHVRGNVVGYVAVFLALCGGAYAAGLKKNSVKSKHIQDGQVQSVDIADNGVTGTDVDESTLTGVDAATLGGKSASSFLATGATAANADQLDGQDATAFLGSGAKAADADLLDGQNSTAFLGSTAKAADADQLDGLNSTAFLGSTAKAADADQLDGLNSTAFLPVGGTASDADQLDGQDSTAFLGSGAKAADADLLDGQNSTAYKTGTIGKTTPGAGGSQLSAGFVAGVGSVMVRCGTTSGGDAGVPKVQFHNSSGGSVRLITAEVAGISNPPATVPGGAFVSNNADSTELLGPTTQDSVSHVVYWVNTSGSAAQVRYDIIGINQTTSGCTFLSDVTENAP